MKRALFTVLLTILVMLACTRPAQALDTTFAGAGTGTTTLSYYIASANNAGVPRLNYVHCTSDKAASVLQFYTAGTPATVTIATNASQVVIYTTGTGNFNTNDVIVVRSVTNDTYQRLVVATVVSTNITTTANLSFALVAGDKLYRMATAGAIPWGVSTNSINANGGGIYNGQEGKPLLFEIDGTSACKINVASGVFQK